MKPTITIHNEFHGTQTCTSVYQADSDTQVRVGRHTAAKLCSSQGCTCRLGVVTHSEDRRIEVGASVHCYVE